jgi:hypothetical protein
VEPISTYLERRRKGPIYPVVVANGFVYLSGLPPFDPDTGDIKPLPFERAHRMEQDPNDFSYCSRLFLVARRPPQTMFQDLAPLPSFIGAQVH